MGHVRFIEEHLSVNGYNEMNKRAIGKEYEKLAVSYLISKGYLILEQNYYSAHGEIDIIAKDDDTIVFIEVKFRSSSQRGFPSEAVTRAKQRSMQYTAKQYLYQQHDADDTKCRFDVVSILGDQITLISDAF